MLKSLFNFFRFFLFWLIFFALTRIAFELYFFKKLQVASFPEIIKTFLYAFRLDASAAAYICIIPLLIYIINWFLPYQRIHKNWLKGYVWFCVLLISFLAIIDLGIFQEWGTKVNYRVFDTLFHAPGESVASTSSSPIVLNVSIGVALLASGILLSLLIIDFNFKKPQANTSFKIAASILFALMNFIIIRGGIQGYPANQSMAYFSDKQILNQSALNTEFNLGNNVVENLRSLYNPYEVLPKSQSEELVKNMYKVDKDTTLHVLTTNKPNIVIIQLESFTADLIESLGGEKGDAPNFEKFIQEGLLFDNIYASGDRTDKGIISILSGFPSQAIRTIITDNTRQERLPALSVNLKKQGYQTSYCYGGESEYMNFKSYLLSHKIDTIVDRANFDDSEIHSRWGAYDGDLLTKHLNYLRNQDQPFFSYVQTSTSHEPFDMPGSPHFKGIDVANKFRSTAYYTDSCLNAYFENAKKQSWYKNTLFVLVADHGHRLPRNNDAFEPAKYHVPLLFYGDVIKPEFRGKRNNKLGGQTDIAATILAQLNLPNTDFKWSKNLLNPYSKDFAFFNWDNGFGFITPQQAVSYDNAGKTMIYNKNKNADKETTDKTLLCGKAFLQNVFAEYVAY